MLSEIIKGRLEFDHFENGDHAKAQPQADLAAEIRNQGEPLSKES